MATEVTHIVDPGEGAGHDYHSLLLWEAGEAGDLTGVRDEIAIAKCRATSGTADDSEEIYIDGWTTSATQYIKIWTDPAEGFRHDGKWNTSKYRVGALFYSSELYVRVIGLQFYRTIDADYALVSMGAGGNRFLENIVTSTAATKTLGIGIVIADYDSGTVILANNIVDNFRYGVYLNPAGGSVSVLNNTVYGCGTGFACYWENVTSINNMAVGCTDCFLESYAFDVATNNAFDEGTDPGSSGQDISGSTDAQIFVAAASKDFHLVSGSPVIGDGANLYNDATYPFQNDIDGDDRGGAAAAWDIGADEYVAAGGSVIPLDDRGILRGMGRGINRGMSRIN